MKDTPFVSNTFVKFVSISNPKDVIFLSIEELISSGVPIDYEGEEMFQDGDDLYCEEDEGEYSKLG